VGLGGWLVAEAFWLQLLVHAHTPNPPQKHPKNPTRHPPACQVFVASLPHEATEEQVKEFITSAGIQVRLR